MQYGMLGNKKAGDVHLRASRIGLGCMGLSEFYGVIPPKEDGVRLIRSAYDDFGINYFDTADQYGFGANEEILGEALKELPRDKVVVATKCGVKRDPSNPAYRGLDGSSAYIKSAVEASLHRLALDYVDLLYLHRVDSKVPFEESVRAMAELVQEGKVRAIGFSEITPEQIKLANAIHPVAGIQTEYSLWFRTPEVDGVLATCRELGISFVPYSPLGRGFLSGEIRSVEGLPPTDFRRGLPRFQAENMEHNLRITDAIKMMAVGKGVSAAQLALAWMLYKSDDIFPIPGTTKLTHLASNAVVPSIILTREEVEALEKVAPLGCAKGARYPESAMKAFSYSDDNIEDRVTVSVSSSYGK